MFDDFDWGSLLGYDTSAGGSGGTSFWEDPSPSFTPSYIPEDTSWDFSFMNPDSASGTQFGGSDMSYDIHGGRMNGGGMNDAAYAGTTFFDPREMNPPVAGQGTPWSTQMSGWIKENPELFKLGIGGLGGLVSGMSAASAKKDALKKQKLLAAEARAKAMAYAKYNEPIRVAMARQQVAAPQRRSEGETSFFTQNSLRDNLPNVVTAATGGYYAGGTKGQDDKIPAMLSDGEFVIDAETVSMLGDGNNAAGAGALEQMRQNIRKQKRSAPTNKIPPKAKAPEQYLKKGKK